MLTAYQTALTSLIQAPNSPVPLVPVASQTTFINEARAQVAADAECIRGRGLLTINASVQVYPFSAITIPPNNSAVISVRSGLLNGNPMEVRSFEWFSAYYLGSIATGVPTIMAQQGQGVDGTIYVAPIPPPAGSFALILDVCVLPIPLADDTTAETIPQLWQDAVPFYAAWLAMQTLQRQTDAELMFRRYQTLAQRGRQLMTPTELPDNLPGGMGARMAAVKTILSAQQAPTGGGR